MTMTKRKVIGPVLTDNPNTAKADEREMKITLWWEKKPLEGQPTRLVLIAKVEHPALTPMVIRAPDGADYCFFGVTRKLQEAGMVYVVEETDAGAEDPMEPNPLVAGLIKASEAQTAEIAELKAKLKKQENDHAEMLKKREADWAKAYQDKLAQELEKVSKTPPPAKRT